MPPIQLQRSRYPRLAFTLVEMLVVIGLIGILSAIIIPVVGSAKQRAHELSCASDLRHIGTAIHLYANEHSWGLPGPLWGRQSARYPTNDSGQLLSYLDEYIETEVVHDPSAGPGAPGLASIMLCPAATQTANGYQLRHYAINVGRVTVSSGEEERLFGYPRGGGSDGDEPISPAPLNRILEPATVYVLKDMDKLDFPGNNQIPEEPAHNDRRNVLYLDGHVESVPVNQ